MTRKAPIALLLVALALAMAGPATAQDAGFTIESVAVADHPEVAVTVTVENQLLGGEIPEFIITEDGQAVEVSVEAAASDDLNVVLLLDVSGSMAGGPLAGAKDAASQFINQMPPGVQMSVVSFGSSAALAAEFTDDKPTLQAAIDLLSARGETALYDGLNSAAALLNNEAQAGRPSSYCRTAGTRSVRAPSRTRCPPSRASAPHCSQSSCRVPKTTVRLCRHWRPLPAVPSHLLMTRPRSSLCSARSHPSF